MNLLIHQKFTEQEIFVNVGCYYSLNNGSWKIYSFLSSKNSTVHWCSYSDIFPSQSEGGVVFMP